MTIADPSAPDCKSRVTYSEELAEPAPHAATTPPQPCSEEDAPAGFSDQAFVFWARMDDGSSFLAIIDPDPPEVA